MIHTLIRFYKWYKNLKTGYYVAIYDCDLDTWLRACHTGGDRYIVTQGNWEYRTTSQSGYNACVEAGEWFNSIKVK